VPKPQIAIVAIVSIAVLYLAVAVGTAKHTPALSARVVEVVNTGNDLKVIVQVTNSTAYVYWPVPVGLEVWNGTSWDETDGCGPLVPNVPPVTLRATWFPRIGLANACG
jgi:hypothetical protein